MKKLNLVSYCGLYCEDCFNYTGSIADLARDLRKELRKSNFDKVVEALPFKEFDNYSECYECLGGLENLRCEGCRDGSRAKFCHIAQCAQKNEYQGCWECGEFETCKEFEFLKPLHKDANLKNLRKIKEQGVEGFLNGKRYW
ncbi:DUF3795 domain-containing protein [Methanobacterium formicicum]|uniref:DUF3795 domain-containing protein n=1 Tax=Methanobacterium formicicum (strain DSM 3637 / PP1) TaxID=1204725 RepID=K2R8Q1_METFP|nr:DUF3795 domain-containing protein [Methanobacterium formicicum]EKF84699.1 hypothetical protein A994_12508 [Methanobacterium formicicum DSM 3637]